MKFTLQCIWNEDYLLCWFCFEATQDTAQYLLPSWRSGVTPDKAQGILYGLNLGQSGASKCLPSKSPVPLQNEGDKLHFGHCLRIVAGGSRERSYPARVIHRKLFSGAVSPDTGYGS